MTPLLRLQIQGPGFVRGFFRGDKSAANKGRRPSDSEYLRKGVSAKGDCYAKRAICLAVPADGAAVLPGRRGGGRGTGAACRPCGLV